VRILHVEPSRYEADARRILEGVGAVDYVECATQPAFMQALGRAPYDAVFARLGLALDRAALAAAPALRWIVTPTTGLDHIDVQAAAGRGVRIISLRGETEFLDAIRSTAEHTWALLLALERRLVAAHADVLAGGWRRDGFLCGELDGTTLGIIGCGRLGRVVAAYGLAFRMRVLVHDISPEALARAPAGVTAVGLPQLLAESDVVSLHLPLTDETRQYLSAARLRALKRGAILINTARGELIDEAALLDVLQKGHLAGAALDVLAGDGRWDGQVPAGHPLVAYARQHERLLLSPHIGGYGVRSIARTRRFVAQRFAEAVRG
jgi:D-3-phosphoglycerate dehydrogenase